jgi:hypothetical protein
MYLDRESIELLAGLAAISVFGALLVLLQTL